MGSHSDSVRFAMASSSVGCRLGVAVGPTRYRRCCFPLDWPLPVSAAIDGSFRLHPDRSGGASAFSDADGVRLFQAAAFHSTLNANHLLAHSFIIHDLPACAW